jgi:PadR family transcriptional regulator PadR
MAPTNRRDLLPGTLDMLVLKTLTVQPMHGYGIAQELQRRSRDVIRVEEGSLYPALYRMTRKAWIKGSWGTSENNRRAKFYTLTPKGRAQLRLETATWTRYAYAVFAALEAPPQPT